jgi:hypothetical protein
MNLRNNLINALKSVPAWVSLANAIQAVNDAAVEPTLERLKSRTRLFDMHPDDVKVLFSELGAVFSVGNAADEDRPLLLQQRQDEIHQKSTTYPLEKTLEREYENIRVRWRPLFAPCDLGAHPYGSLLSPEPDLGVYEVSPEQWFKTSRGVVEINITDLYRMYPDLSLDDAMPEFELSVNRVIKPLIPIRIVFDGHYYILRIDISDVLDEISKIEAEAYVSFASFLSIPTYRIGITRMGTARLDSPSDASLNKFPVDSDIHISMRSLSPSYPIRLDSHRVGQYRLGMDQTPTDGRFLPFKNQRTHYPTRLDFHRLGQNRLGLNLLPPDSNFVFIARTIEL